MDVSEQEMREAIGSELADILHRQKTIVKCNNSLNLLEGSNVKDEFRTMAEEDENNLKMIETVIGSFGIRVDPKVATIKLADTLEEIITDPNSMPLEMLGSYTLLKQNQLMCAHLVHKSAQLALPDVKAAIGPFEGVYSTFGRQISELNGFVERAGVEWITGKLPAVGIIGRARDALGAVAGAILSRTATPAEDMSVLNVLKVDHRKVDVLFKEIEGAPDQNQASDIFQQLKADLTAHSIAEEETVYSRFERIAEMKKHMADARQEHQDMRSLLDDISDVLMEKEMFMDRVEELKDLVKHHVDEEEDEIFDLITKHSTESELISLSQEFMLAKQRIQENVGVEPIVASAANTDEATKSGTQAST